MSSESKVLFKVVGLFETGRRGVPGSRIFVCPLSCDQRRWSCLIVLIVAGVSLLLILV